MLIKQTTAFKIIHFTSLYVRLCTRHVLLQVFGPWTDSLSKQKKSSKIERLICRNFKKEELKGGWVSRPKFFGNILSAVASFPFTVKLDIMFAIKSFVISRFFFIYFTIAEAKENRSLYRGLLEVRYIEVPLCNETSPFQMSTAYLCFNQSLLFCY